MFPDRTARTGPAAAGRSGGGILRRPSRKVQARHDTIHQGGRDVTELLEKAFAKVARLPDHEQNALARWLMGELESERRWSRAFETSQGQLAELAREALEDYPAGRTEPLDPDGL